VLDSSFFDETHVKPADLRRKYGYSFRGVPAFMRVPFAGHGQGLGCCGLAAMALDGMLSITVTEQVVDHVLLIKVLEDEVLPHMSRFPAPRSVLVMDNASTHTHAAIVALCTQVGVVCVFLPPYSYDFNPIEPAFHQAKQYVRNAYGLADGVAADRLFEGLGSIEGTSAVNYYIHCGYGVTQQDRDWAGV
jgi:phosphohistidine swiveling domain-containing protein